MLITLYPENIIALIAIAPTKRMGELKAFDVKMRGMCALVFFDNQ